MLKIQPFELGSLTLLDPLYTAKDTLKNIILTVAWIWTLLVQNAPLKFALTGTLKILVG